jgi:hypothetical protein
MAHDELTLGMASTDHILLGNHDVIHTNGSAPTTSFYPVQVDHVGSLDPMVEPRLSNISTTSGTPHINMRTSNEITRCHAAASQVIRWLPGAMPRQAKPGTKTRSNTVGKPSITVK